MQCVWLRFLFPFVSDYPVLSASEDHETDENKRFRSPSELAETVPSSQIPFQETGEMSGSGKGFLGLWLYKTGEEWMLKDPLRVSTVLERVHSPSPFPFLIFSLPIRGK